MPCDVMSVTVPDVIYRVSHSEQRVPTFPSNSTVLATSFLGTINSASSCVLVNKFNTKVLQ